ncbi:MAG: hypothetical protein IKM28_04975 [Lachnospiraceae bacterium]|nr:hypothetical protein [Lachnospiraceae bacterium]
MGKSRDFRKRQVDMGRKYNGLEGRKEAMLEKDRQIWERNTVIEHAEKNRFGKKLQKS